MKKNKSYPKSYPHVEKDIDKDGRPVHREYHKIEGFPADFDTERFGDTIAKVILHNVPERHLPYLKKRLGMAPKPAEKKPYESLRRVYAFILVEAHNRKLIDVLSMGQSGLIDYISQNPKIEISGNTVSTTILYGSKKYPKEKAFISYYPQMAKLFTPDYGYAMTIFQKVFHS